MRNKKLHIQTTAIMAAGIGGTIFLFSSPKMLIYLAWLIVFIFVCLLTIAAYSSIYEWLEGEQAKSRVRKSWRNDGMRGPMPG